MKISENKGEYFRLLSSIYHYPKICVDIHVSCIHVLCLVITNTEYEIMHLVT